MIASSRGSYYHHWQSELEQIMKVDCSLSHWRVKPSVRGWYWVILSSMKVLLVSWNDVLNTWLLNCFVDVDSIHAVFRKLYNNDDVFCSNCFAYYLLRERQMISSDIWSVINMFACCSRGASVVKDWCLLTISWSWCFSWFVVRHDTAPFLIKNFQFAQTSECCVNWC